MTAADISSTRRALPLRASLAAWFSALPGVALHRVRRCLRRLAADGEPQTADELLAYARRIENDRPSLAADLRGAALRHQNTSL